MRPLRYFTTLLLFIAAAGGCSTRRTPALVSGPSCRPVAGTEPRDTGLTVAGLAGRYELTVGSYGPEHPGQTVTGMLQLWPTSSADSSPATGERPRAGDTRRFPLFGATNLDLYKFRVEESSAEVNDRARTDPLYPKVMATVSGNVIGGRQRSTLALWIASSMNRGGVDVRDGAGHHFTVLVQDTSGLRGTWEPAGIVLTDSGYFCARRVR